MSRRDRHMLNQNRENDFLSRTANGSSTTGTVGGSTTRAMPPLYNEDSRYLTADWIQYRSRDTENRQMVERKCPPARERIGSRDVRAHPRVGGVERGWTNHLVDNYMNRTERKRKRSPSPDNGHYKQRRVDGYFDYEQPRYEYENNLIQVTTASDWGSYHRGSAQPY